MRARLAFAMAVDLVVPQLPCFIGRRPFTAFDWRARQMWQPRWGPSWVNRVLLDVPCLCHACASSSWKWPELERSQGSAILRAALNSIDIIQKHPETSRNIQSYTTAAVKFSVCWMTWELLWHCDTVSCVQCPWGKVIWMAQSPPMRCTTARHMWHRTS